jgi:hypothetical protein
MITIYKIREQLWALKWHHLILLYSWENLMFDILNACEKKLNLAAIS